MKKLIRNFSRNFGIEITRHRPSATVGSQLAKILDLVHINMVFDIGANEGQFAREIRDHWYSGGIISFKPLSVAWKILLRSVSRDPDWDVPFHNQLNWGEPDSITDVEKVSLSQ